MRSMRAVRCRLSRTNDPRGHRRDDAMLCRKYDRNQKHRADPRLRFHPPVGTALPETTRGSFDRRVQQRRAGPVTKAARRRSDPEGRAHGASPANRAKSDLGGSSSIMKERKISASCTNSFRISRGAGANAACASPRRAPEPSSICPPAVAASATAPGAGRRRR
jgi:hypothetical protein